MLGAGSNVGFKLRRRIGQHGTALRRLKISAGLGVPVQPRSLPGEQLSESGLPREFDDYEIHPHVKILPARTEMVR
jgi:hypothetical protein